MPIQRIDTINELANDIMVARLEIQEYELQIEQEMAKIPKIKECEDKILEAKKQKEELQEKLLSAMKSNELKSWKTEQASFARAIRQSATIDPAYKKQIESRLKDGQEVENWTLESTEYISIRLTPKK